MKKKVLQGHKGTAEFEKIRLKMSTAYLNKNYVLAMKYSKQLDALMVNDQHLPLILPKKYLQDKRASNSPHKSSSAGLVQIAR